jgi:excisionase family DNA binding protein
VGEGPRRDTRRRLSVSEAADALGITVDAVRSRVKRGTIAHERVGGRVYVLLGADQSRPGHDQGTDRPGPAGEDRTDELIATLREQLQAERAAHAEARRIIAGLVERMPQLEAPSEPSGTPSEATSQPGRVEPQPAVESAQEPRESSEMHMPEVGGGPLPHDQQRAAERRWWEFWR